MNSPDESGNPARWSTQPDRMATSGLSACVTAVSTALSDDVLSRQAGCPRFQQRTAPSIQSVAHRNGTAPLRLRTVDLPSPAFDATPPRWHGRNHGLRTSRSPMNGFYAAIPAANAPAPWLGHLPKPRGLRLITARSFTCDGPSARYHIDADENAPLRRDGVTSTEVTPRGSHITSQAFPCRCGRSCPH